MKPCSHEGCQDEAEYRVTYGNVINGEQQEWSIDPSWFCQAHAVLDVLDWFADGIPPLTIEYVPGEADDNPPTSD